MGKNPDTSAAVRTVRHMDQIGAGDVAVGQVWFHSITHANERGFYRVTSVTEDRVVLDLVRRVGNDPERRAEATVGTLLAHWVLTREAATNAAAVA